MVQTLMASSQPPEPQWWGTRPLGREHQFTQHESHNIAGDPQRLLKCLFFKLVSKADEKLSEICNEEFNPESQQRGKRKQKREASGFWNRNAKGVNKWGKKNNCHISKTVQIYICRLLFSILQVLSAFEKRHMLFSLPEKLNSTYLTNFYVFLRQSSPPLEKATPSSDLFSYDPKFVIVYFNVQYHDYELRVL